jgi:predicted AlkP superfamily phosphohydrolase/phosphomutase
MSRQGKPCVVLLGLWGLSPQNLPAWIQAGELPFLASLEAEGVSGPLEPTLPRYFSVAWATWLSGQNPARHGLWEEHPEKSLNKVLSSTSAVNLLANPAHHTAFFNPPSSLALRPRQGLQVFSLESKNKQSPRQAIEQWGEGFHSSWQAQAWDFFAASLDFSGLFSSLKDGSSLSIVKAWEQEVNKTLSPYYSQISILLAGASKSSGPQRFSLENFLEADGFLKKKGKSIDFAATLAYPAGEREIKINLKGREPRGKVEPGKAYEKIRDNLIQKLSNKYVSGHPSSELKIYKKEELFSGELLEAAPDLLLDFQAGESQGFFMGLGSPLAPNKKIASRRGIDIAPTILYLMGQEIPADMEGQIIKAAVSDDFLRVNPPRLMAESQEQKGLPPASAEKLERIIERLKGLGYLT